MHLICAVSTCAQIQKSERKRWCSVHHISARSMNKALDILGQLRRHVAALRLPLVSSGTDLDPIRRALLAGLFMHAAVLRPDGAWWLGAMFKPFTEQHAGVPVITSVSRISQVQRTQLACGVTRLTRMLAVKVPTASWRQGKPWPYTLPQSCVGASLAVWCLTSC